MSQPIFLSVFRIQAGDEIDVGTHCIGGGLWQKDEANWTTSSNGTKAMADALFFGLHSTAPGLDMQGLLAVQQAEVPGRNALIRLDQVTFPPGAIAYRHIHPGPGFRHLVKGQFRVISDHHQETARKGQVWFEPANSPVRAEASADHPITRFLRLMVLPPEFEGRPTIDILDPADREKPRLQTTHRFFDQVIDLHHSG